MELFTDRQVCEELGISIDVLKKIRAIMRKIGMLVEKERINREKLEFIRRVVEKHNQIGGKYETAVNLVLEEQKRRALRRIFEERDDTFALDVFCQALGEHFDNADEILDNFLNNFVEIVDVLRKIGDENSAEELNAIQESIITKVAFKYLYRKGRIK